jgi:hypothetical protein
VSGDEKQAAASVCCVLLQKMLCDNIRVGSWPVMAQLITLLSFQGQIQPLNEGKRGVGGEYRGFCDAVYVIFAYTSHLFSLTNINQIKVSSP